MTDSWKELHRAINGKTISDEVKLSFFSPEKNIISLVIDGIDNKYTQSVGGEANWEIYLNKDGTWRIA